MALDLFVFRNASVVVCLFVCLFYVLCNFIGKCAAKLLFLTLFT